MSVTLHNGIRIRIYISLGTVKGKKQCIQEYISLVGLSKKEELKAWKQAYKREAELRAEHQALTRVDKRDTPFRFEIKRQSGKHPDSPFMIRGLTMYVPSPQGTRQLVPDWSKKGYVYTFHSYPPRIAFQLFNYADGERDYFHTKSFTLYESTDYSTQFEKAIDYIIQVKPVLRQYREEMIASMPTWPEVRKFLERKYHAHWDEYPWVVKAKQNNGN